MTFNSHTSTDVRPWEVDADRYAHGTRARYVAAKCRCEPCRAANRAYARERARASDSRRLVPVAAAVAHIRKLRAVGVGRRTIAQRAGISCRTMHLILRGERPHLRADVSQRILSVTADVADGTRVDARPTHATIKRLLGLGLTRGEIALELGLETPALQFRRTHVTARNARAIEALYARIVAQRRVDFAFCTDCGHAHTPGNRQRLIARMDLSDPESIREAWPCFYGTESGHSSGMRLLHRDLVALRGMVRPRRSDGSGVGRGAK